MSKEFEELKDRLVKLSDEQLIEMVLAPPGEYRQDALDIAKAELKWRRVEIPEPEEPEATSDPVSDDPLLSRLGRRALRQSECLHPMWTVVARRGFRNGRTAVTAPAC